MTEIRPRSMRASTCAVAFDLDGLIANTEDLYEQAGETVLQRRGKTYDAELREKIMGRPVVDSLRIMIDCHSLPDALEDLLCECSEVLQKLIATSLAPMPGVVELVGKLRAPTCPSLSPLAGRASMPTMYSRASTLKSDSSSF